MKKMSWSTRMKTIIFVCHGNICRSPMAEALFSYLAKENNMAGRFVISSRATSTEELGNPVHPKVKQILARFGLSVNEKRAEQITRSECDEADLVVIMDERNRRGLQPFIGKNSHKVKTLLSFAGLDRDISDPWYTGDFETTQNDILLGCKALLQSFMR